MAYLRSPFEYTTQKPLVKNYAEIFDPQEYECKDSIELEAYARNLHNYLKTLLGQNPFPAFLFEKLEKRLDGITSILQKRSAAIGVLDKKAALKRLQGLGERLDTAVPPSLPDPMDEVPTPEPKLKRQRTDPGYIEEVRKENESLKALRLAYRESNKENIAPEEEEED